MKKNNPNKNKLSGYKLSSYQPSKKDVKTLYLCYIYLAHPNFPYESHSFSITKRIEGNHPLIIESFDLRNIGTVEYITKMLENKKRELVKKYPGIKFKIDAKYRSYFDIFENENKGLFL